jgi:SAM-dependent methyltransferase
MTGASKPSTLDVNGRLWGARAQDWAEIQEGKFRPVYIAAFDAVGIKPGAKYLDAGCGAGLAAQIAAERGAQVFGIDASANLLEIARHRVPTGQFELSDLESLPYPDGEFDLVAGFNSFQYAGNPDKALREARRVTRPRGHVVIVTWGDPEGMEAASLLEALRPLLPAPPPGAPGPFALSDESALRDFAGSAGLVPVRVFDVDCPWQYPDLSTALRGLRSAGVVVHAIENSSEEAVDRALSQALAPFCRKDGSYRIGTTMRCLLSRVW